MISGPKKREKMGMLGCGNSVSPRMNWTAQAPHRFVFLAKSGKGLTLRCLVLARIPTAQRLSISFFLSHPGFCREITDPPVARRKRRRSLCAPSRRGTLASTPPPPPSFGSWTHCGSALQVEGRAMSVLHLPPCHGYFVLGALSSS